jgi:protein SCO1/2
MGGHRPGGPGQVIRLATSLGWAHRTSASILVLLLGSVNASQAQIVRPGDDLGNVKGPNVPEMELSKIEERLGEKLPLDLSFVDESGNTVTLGDVIDGVLIAPVYYRCPQLCTLVLNGMVDGLDDVQMQPGKDYRLLSFTFAAGEDYELSAAKRSAYLTRLPSADVDGGWTFLAGADGDDTNAKALCAAIGFEYTFHEPSGEYIHPACVAFVSPDGTITRYMNDVVFPPKDLRLAIVEAGDGKVGTSLDKFLLFTCFAYNADHAGYSVSVMKLMRSGGILTMACVAIALGTQFRPRLGGGQPVVTS